MGTADLAELSPLRTPVPPGFGQDAIQRGENHLVVPPIEQQQPTILPPYNMLVPAP